MGALCAYGATNRVTRSQSGVSHQLSAAEVSNALKAFPGTDVESKEMKFSILQNWVEALTQRIALTDDLIFKQNASKEIAKASREMQKLGYKEAAVLWATRAEALSPSLENVALWTQKVLRGS